MVNCSVILNFDMPVIYDPIGLLRGACGGAILGIDAALLMALTGQTLGFSGIVGGVVREGFPGQQPWRVSFLLGTLAAGGILTLALGSPGSLASTAVFGVPQPIHWLVALTGGLLVGYGTRLGNGCTSGHGVCGIPRGSPRSLAAVGTFMAVAALSAGLSRAPFSRPSLYSSSDNTLPGGLYIVPMIGAMLLAFLVPTIESMIYTSSSTKATAPIQSSENTPTVSLTESKESAMSTETLLKANDTDSTSVQKSEARLRHNSSGGSSSPVLQRASVDDDKIKNVDIKTENKLSTPVSDMTTSSTSAPLMARVQVLSGVFVGGLVAGLALALSGMAEPAKVFRFLDFTGVEGWDPQLAFVMGGAVVTNGLAVYLLACTTRSNTSPSPVSYASTQSGGIVKAKSIPKFSELLPLALSAPNMKIDSQLLIGAALFGAGWGLTGVCPGPAIVNFASGTSSHVAISAAGTVVGMVLFEARARAMMR